MRHMCLVCGFLGMRDAPRDFEICPCCGTEFGLDDVERSHADLRQDWMARGAQWFSKATKPPARWDAMEQLAEADFLPYANEVDASAPLVVPVVELRKGKSRYQRA